MGLLRRAHEQKNSIIVVVCPRSFGISLSQPRPYILFMHIVILRNMEVIDLPGPRRPALSYIVL